MLCRRTAIALKMISEKYEYMGCKDGGVIYENPRVLYYRLPGCNIGENHLEIHKIMHNHLNSPSRVSNTPPLSSMTIMSIACMYIIGALCCHKYLRHALVDDMRIQRYVFSTSHKGLDWINILAVISLQISHGL